MATRTGMSWYVMRDVKPRTGCSIWPSKNADLRAKMSNWQYRKSTRRTVATNKTPNTSSSTSGWWRSSVFSWTAPEVWLLLNFSSWWATKSRSSSSWHGGVNTSTVPLWSNEWNGFGDCRDPVRLELGCLPAWCNEPLRTGTCLPIRCV